MDDVSPTTPLISVVIPLYNEGSHLRELLADLKTALQETRCRFEVVLVDDGSSDNTWVEIKHEAWQWRYSDGRRWATPPVTFAAPDSELEEFRSRRCRSG